MNLTLSEGAPDLQVDSVPPPVPEAPYRGIEPFRFIDQQIFAARSEETWTLFSNVTLYRAVLLYGDSGTGKSSLINAGLLPQIVKENYVADRLRVQPFAGREIKVERIRKSVSAAGVEYLPSNFTAAKPDAASESIELSVDAFRERLEQFRPGAVQESSAEPRADERASVRPLLIFDQFEEFITLFEEANRVGVREISGRIEDVRGTQNGILNLIVSLIQDQTLPVKIIFAFREDYLAKLYLLFDHCPQLLDQAQRLLPPHVDLLPEIIRAPFVDPVLRAHFEQARAHTSDLSDDLARRISQELSLRSEGDRANLTELQIVCQRLWEAADAEAMFSKGVEGILNCYGDDVINDFTPEVRDAAIVLLSHLITASDTRNIISEDDLLNWADKTLGAGEPGKARLRGALKSLSDSQIVRRERRRNIYFYEITSEYLVRWIKLKVADRKSIVERSQAAKARADLETKRAEAVANFHQERKRLRRVQIFSVSLAVLLILTGALGLAVAYLYKRARQDRIRAEKLEAQAREEKQTTERVLFAIKLTTSAKKEDALLGVAQLDELIKEDRIPAGLKRVLLAPVLSSTDVDVKKAALKVAIYAAKDDPDPELKAAVVEVEKADPALVQTLSGGAADNFKQLSESLGTRLYIHIADESQRPLAQKVADKLKGKYLVPGIANVGINAPRVNQLRYFHKDAAEADKLKQIVADLKAASGITWNDTYISGYEDSRNIRPDHFEVWFAAPENTSNGWLRAYPTDEQGQQLSGIDISFQINKASSGETVRKRTGYVALPSGDYELFATADGYQTADVHFTIKPGEELKLPVKMIKSTKPPARK